MLGRIDVNIVNSSILGKRTLGSRKGFISQRSSENVLNAQGAGKLPALIYGPLITKDRDKRRKFLSKLVPFGCRLRQAIFPSQQ